MTSTATGRSLPWTAKHVIEYIRDKFGLNTVGLRVNRKDSTSQWVETKLKDWVLHDSADVAALKIGINEYMDHYGWPTLAFGTQEVIREREIGVGDELFLTGMYHRRLW